MLLTLAAVVLLGVAYFSHLGDLPVDPRTDENRRALVTLELMNRHDYLVPTLNGVEYLNKPPLYNWIIAASYNVFGVNAFALRFPSIISLFLFGFMIYAFLKQHLPEKIAILAALLFITNGRILLYDSLLGLIDITFSGLVFFCFMGIYHWGVQKKYLTLFVLTYAAAALAFLMKGLPALFFQGSSLLVFFLWQKDFKRLLSLKHLAGIGVFIALAGSYYLAYFQRSQTSLQEMFGNMLNENTKRTVAQSDTGNMVRHFLGYPFSWFYHFAPWAVLLIAAFRKDFKQTAQSNPFIFYNVLVFLPGFMVYWLSPNIDTAARYYFMLVPLFYTVGLWFYLHPGAPRISRRIVDILLWILFGALVAGSFVPPFVPALRGTEGLGLKTIFLVLALAGLFWLAFKKPGYRLLCFVLMLGVFRLAFNWFVIENRGGYQQEQISHFETVMSKVNPRKLYLEKSAYTGNTDGFSYLYMLRTGNILQATDSIAPGSFYITGEESAGKYPHRVLYRWPNYVSRDVWLVEALPH